MEAATPQTFVDHLRELWRRLAISVLVLIAGGVAGYMERQLIITKLQQPLHLPLFYTSPSGSFEFIMQISLVIGIVLALPVLIYNLLRFIEPAFSSSRLSRLRMALVLITSVSLALMGMVFAYKIILPTSFHFFAGFSIGGIIKPLISANSYLTFVMSCLVSFAVIFQLPLILFFINSIHRFPPGSLRKYRRHVIVGSFVLALVLPFTYDPLTQFIMAMPIVVLYEVSLLLIWWANRKHTPKKSKASQPLPVNRQPVPAVAQPISPPLTAHRQPRPVVLIDSVLPVRRRAAMPVKLPSTIPNVAPHRPAPMLPVYQTRSTPQYKPRPLQL